MPTPVQTFPITNAQISRAVNRAVASMTPAQAAALIPYIGAERTAAAAMTDDEFWGWDRQYNASAGVAPATLVDLTEQGACGGGGCSPSYSNSQFWRANVACSPDVYARVLFQYRRYLAAQIRLATLLQNPPQSWPGRMYFGDSQDADGCSTTLPIRPAGEQPLSSKANEWATWCIDVMRLVAVARWASGVRWSEGTRAGAGGMGSANGRGAATGLGWFGGMGEYDPSRVFSTADAYGQWTMQTTRPITLQEMGTVAGCIGQTPTLIDAASSGSPPYLPDVALSYMAAYHPVGYFRPTSPRGLGPARWTWGVDELPAPLVRATKGFRGLNEIGRSTLPQAQIFQRFRTTDNRFPLVSMEYQGTDLPYYTGTWLQLSECLATRHGNASGPHDYVMPESKGDFDPIITPELISAGTHIVWPDDFAQPTDTTPHGVLMAIFNQSTVAPSGLIDQQTLVDLRAQWQLHWSSAAFRFMPAGLRQIWWCMGLAYDVVDAPMGTAVSQAFGNFATGLLQLPPTYRVTNPAEGAAAARAGAQGQLDAIFAGCSAAAGAIAAAGSALAAVPALSVALEVVAALVAVAGALAQQATSVGLARVGNPPIMPTIMMRVAGRTDPSDPCWLVADARDGAGGSSSLSTRAAAVQQAASSSEDPTSWYAQVQAAIEAGGGGAPPPTAAAVNKGVALGAGAIAGLALVKILGLGAK